MTTMLEVLDQLGRPVSGWLLTYLLHSTLLLGSAWLLTTRVVKREAWRDVLWKAALMGAVLSATVSTLALRPLDVRIAWPAVPSALTQTPHDATPEVTRSSTAEIDRARAPEAVPDGTLADPTLHDHRRGTPSHDRRSRWADDEDGTAGAGAPSRSTGARRGSSAAGDMGPVAGALGTVREVWGQVRRDAALLARSSVPGLLVLTWALLALLGLINLAYQRVRLGWLISDRRDLVEGPLPRMLARLRRSTGFWRPVRLTATSSVATPLALGSSEICVPERLLVDLGPDEQKAALAHELGHLARHDPGWHLAARLLSAVCFFQPLHHLARHRLRESAEYLADAWAVRQTGSRLGLARCLSEVADWVSPAGARSLAATVAMAEGGSPLLARVRRLLEGEPESASPVLPRVVVAGTLVALAVVFAPAVGSGRVVAGGAGGSIEKAAAESPSALGMPDPTPAAEDSPSKWERSQEEAPGQQVVDVVRLPATGALEGRVEAARAAADGDDLERFWVAYVVESALGPGTRVSQESGPYSVSSWGEMMGVEALLRVQDEVGPDGSGDVVVLAQLRDADDSRVRRLALKSPGLGIDLEGRTVFWLGRASPSESVGWTHALFLDGRQSSGVREGALSILGRHATDEARGILVEVATSFASSEIREEAVEGLVHHPTDGVVTLLEGLATRDAARTIRLEAAESLGELDHPAATDALAAMILGSDDGELRAEALEALAERSEEATLDVLAELVVSDPAALLRADALDVLEDLPVEAAVPILGLVLTEVQDRETRIEAIEVLGDIGTPDAFSIIEALVDTETDRRVALELVEVIAEFEDARAQQTLARVARAHPSSSVREEAIDELDGAMGSDFYGQVLLDVALNSADLAERVDAVEEMEELPRRDAVPLLRQVAFATPAVEVQIAVVEVLSDVGTDAALDVLDGMVWTAASEAVQVAAVEAMDDFSRSSARSLLRRIASEHPSGRVRAEARPGGR